MQARPKPAKKVVRAVASERQRGKSTAPVSAPSVKSRMLVVPPAEPLFRATELDGVERPVRRTAPVRPSRPPAKLPIPQSTYFF